MYINPFIFGILTTLFVEMALYIGVTVCKSRYYDNKTNLRRK